MRATLIPVFRLTSSELESLIASRFFSFSVAMATVQRDCVLEYHVDGLPNGELADRVRSGKRSGSVLALLNLLAQDDHIPRGRYLVELGTRRRSRQPRPWTSGQLQIQV